MMAVAVTFGIIFAVLALSYIVLAAALAWAHYPRRGRRGDGKE